jgi:hypothetical protein
MRDRAKASGFQVFFWLTRREREESNRCADVPPPGAEAADPNKKMGQTRKWDRKWDIHPYHKIVVRAQEFIASKGKTAPFLPYQWRNCIKGMHVPFVRLHLESLRPDVWIAAHPEHFLTYRRDEPEAAAIARRRRRERRRAKTPEHSRSP